MPSGLGLCGCRCPYALWQSYELFAIKNELKVIGVFENVLTELGFKLGQLGVEFSHFCFFTTGQTRAASDKILIHVGEQSQLVWSQIEGSASLVEVFDAGEKGVITIEIAGVVRPFFRDGHFQCLSVRVGVRGCQVKKDPRDFIEEASTRFKRLDRVSKSGRIWIGCDGINFLKLDFESLIEGGLKVLVIDAIKWGNAIRRLPFFKKRVAHGARRSGLIRLQSLSGNDDRS